LQQTQNVEASKKLVTSTDKVYTQRVSVVCYYSTFYSHMFFVKYGDPLQTKLLLAAK